MLISFKKNHFYLTVLLALVLPLFQRLVPATVALLLLNYLAQGRFKTRFQEASDLRFVLYSCLFYLAHIIGMAYSDNLQHGLFDLQVKLCFVVLPVIYATSTLLTSSQRKFIMWAFTGSVALAVVYSMVNSYISYIEVRHRMQFYGHNFSRHLHLGYFALYINLSVAFVLNLLLFSEKQKTIASIVVLITLLLLLILAIFLTSSKIGLISLMLMLPGILLYWMVKSGKWFMGLALFALLIFATITVYKTSKKTITYERFELAFKNAFNPDLDKSSVESTATRKFAWKASWNVFSKNPIIGVGTGDIKDRLIEQYGKMGYTGLVRERFNPHNQFIQTAVALGIMGLLPFLLWMFIPLVLAIRRRDLLLILFLFLFFMNALTESLIERQAGVVFTVFFLSVLVWTKTEHSAESGGKIEF